MTQDRKNETELHTEYGIKRNYTSRYVWTIFRQPLTRSSLVCSVDLL